MKSNPSIIFSWYPFMESKENNEGRGKRTKNWNEVRNERRKSGKKAGKTFTVTKGESKKKYQGIKRKVRSEG